MEAINIVVFLLGLLAWLCAPALGEESAGPVRQGQILKSGGEVFMEEVLPETPPGAAGNKQTPALPSPQDLRLEGVKVDAQGKIIPLLQEGGGPGEVVRYFSSTTVYNEPGWVYVPAPFPVPYLYGRPSYPIYPVNPWLPYGAGFYPSAPYWPVWGYPSFTGGAGIASRIGRGAPLYAGEAPQFGPFSGHLWLPAHTQWQGRSILRPLF